MDTRAYRVVGRINGKLFWVESRPERCALHGTMGDYGYTSHPTKALVFDNFSTAEWHASRVYGFDGYRGHVEPDARASLQSAQPAPGASKEGK